MPVFDIYGEKSFFIIKKKNIRRLNVSIGLLDLRQISEQKFSDAGFSICCDLRPKHI